MKKRSRDVAHMWADKRAIRFLRKNYSRKEYGKLRDTYLACCEIDSDFNESRNSNITLRNFTSTCATYAGRDRNTISSCLQILKNLGLIDYGHAKDSSNKVIGSWLSLFAYCEKELSKSHSRVFPTEGKPYYNKNDKSSIVNSVSKETRFSRKSKGKRSKTKIEKILKHDRNTKRLLNTWNNLGPNLRKHKDPNCKAGQTIIKQLNIALKKFEIITIEETFQIYYDFISTPGINHETIGLKIGLDEFFQFSNYIQNKIHKNKNNPLNKNKIQSWFEEICSYMDADDALQGMLNRFGGRRKDNYPKITKLIMKKYSEYTRQTNFNFQDTNNFIKASEKLSGFMEEIKKSKKATTYNIQYTWGGTSGILDVIFEDILSNSKVKPYYLLSNNLWNGKLEKALQERGYIG